MKKILFSLSLFFLSANFSLAAVVQEAYFYRLDTNKLIFDETLSGSPSSLTVLNAGIANDSDIAAIRIYQENGVTDGFQQAEDILVGSKISSPFFGSAIAVNFSAASSSKRVYVVADISNIAVFGRSIQAKVDVNGTSFMNQSAQYIKDKNTTLDSNPPISTISDPISGATITPGQNYTIKGKSIDSGGSSVQNAEISFDGGVSWVAVTPKDAITGSLTNGFYWEYVWSSPVAGDYTIKARAIDWLGNRETPVSSTAVTVAVVAPPAEEPIEEPQTPAEEEPKAPEAPVIDIIDGDLIRVSGTFDIYIVKIIGAKKFKRLILNPDIFNFYGHLKWGNIKDVDQVTVDGFVLSNLIIEVNADGSVVDNKVYRVSSAAGSDTGEKRWLNMSATQFEAAGYDWDAIYKINHTEASENFYSIGLPITQ